MRKRLSSHDKPCAGDFVSQLASIRSGTMNPPFVRQTSSPLLESEFDIAYRIPSADFDLSTIARMCAGNCDALITRSPDDGVYRVSVFVTVPQAEEQDVFARLWKADHLTRLSKKTVRTHPVSDCAKESVPDCSIASVRDCSKASVRDCTNGQVPCCTNERVSDWLLQIKSYKDNFASRSRPAQPSPKQEGPHSGIAGDDQQHTRIDPAATVQQKHHDNQDHHRYEQEAQPQQYHYEQDQYRYEAHQTSQQPEPFGASVLRDQSIKRSVEQANGEDVPPVEDDVKAKRRKAVLSFMTGTALA
ncbi:hypothetical protein PSEUBRA_001126 [Kalmanozyma brasiliensis GHG001]|uniref:uncharacterized protein n=1 Tax=Kalmanozyma brasiliensis (strain GHG001) TaxID=1365824 RepID=UPI00286833DF|nr:uncharacterized protein PSEUBRA_001126 [Kalmanozyma brasiliensis GHG001]KAF6766893.1 hypothetical protein PSEUBRA_001126 [Kalmanozyma brasiliensis GHG001]